MNKSINRYIEIFLTLAILVGFFMPYVEDKIPLDYIFPNSISHMDIFIVTIPILVTIPFLLALIFKDLLKNTLLKILRIFFLVLYVIILGYYIDIFISSLGFIIFGSIADSVIAIVLSLNLLVLNLKYTLLKQDELQNIFLAIMTFPFIFYLSFVLLSIIEMEGNFNYGGYIINIAFLSLYVLALINIFRKHKLNKTVNKS